MDRFNSLEGIRGLFCLVVVLAHFEAGFHGKDFITAEILYYIVDIFFVFSGFLMSGLYWSSLRTRADFADYMIVRTARVYPLHLALLLVFVAFEGFRLLLPESWLDTAPFSGTNDIAAIPYHLTLTQSMGLLPRNTWNFPSWSISTEFYAYIVFAALVMVFRRARVLVALGLIAACVLGLALYSELGFKETYALGFLRCLAGFMVGVLVYRLYDGSRQLKRRVVLMTMMELLAFVLFFAFTLISASPQASLLVPLLIGFLVWALCYDAGLVSRFLSAPLLIYLGTISYSIYLNHVFVQDRMMNLFKLLEMKGVGRFFMPDTEQLSKTSDVLLGLSRVQADLYAALMLIIVVLVSRYTYLWVEVPGRDWAKRVLKRRRAARAAAQAQRVAG